MQYRVPRKDKQQPLHHVQGGRPKTVHGLHLSPGTTHSEGNDEDNPPVRSLQIASRPLRARRPRRHQTASHRHDALDRHNPCGCLPLSFFAPFTTWKMAQISALRIQRQAQERRTSHGRWRCVHKQHRRRTNVLFDWY